ncbi:phospholipid/cholesterol/gamma-HCH transport system substrate-binding protein [Nocardia amikacinitolerans]|uniref:Phospholipid/cholesterol/gamma-HCH transport system substrate-binding protein n=1 Tax=Nocardia amikacinitolerans TaxID=756689 RepID=A0A285LY43_9NOCA|nr:MlaD family protein [Nocardia amikacinitolerans]MCP2279826.1 phospholipid/cholesterol/gamma-HCH transport system substrate-binding protein [Nocardia amikacinitolerans]MCP2300251.1 phospholipid/cholesterol/gamma-HCH transport system substrate-binding protein [Nocardia amikacinitolerans]SNY89077.1 phospholipid/cholesterol/gamma-HCH transport system substrate-binding protein [Nocardia amikacinitolerans]
MKLTRFVRVQLGIFAVLTVIGLTIMAGTYVQLPAMFGIGRYDVTVQLAATGGLYPHANVAYRGTNVGKVDEVRLTPEGVEAKLSIDSDYKIPADVDAWVRSVSAIGEQYVDLIPAESPKGGNLAAGAVIPEDRTKLPQDVGTLLDQTDRLLSSVADTRLRQVIDEAFRAFNGAGPDLQRFIDSASLLVQEAQNSSEPTKKLIEQIGPLLDTQIRSDAAIRSWTADLATVTDQLRAHDPALTGILRDGPAAMQRVSTQFQDLKPTLPLVLANLVSVGQVSTIYHAGLEQLLVVYPPLVAALMTAVRGPVEYGVLVDFMMTVNDPPACTTGFLPEDQRRSPSELDFVDTPPGLYCKIPQDSPIEVRGIRNTPCMEYPGVRAPTPELCRTGYVPEGDNPPFGPPQPVAPASGSAPEGTEVAPASFKTPAAAKSYDPATGVYIGPDGRTYRQGDIGPGGSGTVPSSWQAMLEEQQR